jgi:CheY-like chemotaxis protein
MQNQPTILLVDDNTDDVLLFRFALGRSPLEADLRVAHSGLEAVKYLSGCGLFGNRAEFPMPGIVLLDLQMPGMDGLAVLRWIRRQPSLAGLPVVVFTGAECRRTEAIEQGADIYMRKGEDTGDLLALLQQINLQWQRPARVPIVVVKKARKKEAFPCEMAVD